MSHDPVQHASYCNTSIIDIIEYTPQDMTNVVYLYMALIVMAFLYMVVLFKPSYKRVESDKKGEVRIKQGLLSSASKAHLWLYIFCLYVSKIIDVTIRCSSSIIPPLPPPLSPFLLVIFFHPLLTFKSMSCSCIAVCSWRQIVVLHRNSGHAWLLYCITCNVRALLEMRVAIFRFYLWVLVQIVCSETMHDWLYRKGVSSKGKNPLALDVCTHCTCTLLSRRT